MRIALIIFLILLILALIACGALILTGVWQPRFAFLQGRSEAASPVAEAVDPLPPPPMAESAAPPAPMATHENTIVVIDSPVVEPEIPPPPPADVAAEAVSYTIKWGDTLWDIAAAYYKDPWLYRRIARANNIVNPDLIIAGATIVIPPK